MCSVLALLSGLAALSACAPAPSTPEGTSPSTPDDPRTDPPATPSDPPEPEPGHSSAPEPGGHSAAPAGPDWELADTALYVNVGDSIAAGYDAADQYGYARLLFENDDALAPGFRGHDLVSLSAAAVRHVAESGADSGEILGNLRGASLPAANGPVVVTISAGGNDFNDDPAIMLAEPLTRAVAVTLRANLAAMVAEVRDRYDDVHIYFLTIADPTDGTGSVPSRYDQDLCGVIQSVPAFLRPLGVSNLQVINDAIAAEAAEQGAEVVDVHAAFLNHALTTSDGWMSDDCAHPTTRGHAEIRRVVWEAWTGESL